MNVDIDALFGEGVKTFLECARYLQKVKSRKIGVISI